MKPGPKPRKTTQEFFEQIEHHASRGLSQQQICHALGISETWWYEAKHKNPEISESFKKGQAQGIGEVSNAIFEQALNGSTAAACFFLKKGLPMAVRYLGPKKGKQYFDSMSEWGVTVRVRPERWLAVDYSKS